jgi:sialate O-acetylesterase
LFDHAENGFTSFGQEISAFEVAGADHVFFPAKAKLMPKSVVLVSSEEVKDPVDVRYAFKDWTSGNLYNTAGLPVAPFRTDKLPLQ